MPLDDQIALRRRIEASLTYSVAACALGWVADSLDRAQGGPLEREAEDLQRRMGEMIAELGVLAGRSMEGGK
jgi:hypothetical protein